MKLFGYYFTHTFANQLRKIFKSWVAIFVIVLVACGVIGGVIGAVIENIAENASQSETNPPVEEAPTEEEINEEERRARSIAILELCVGGVSLFMLCLSLVNSEKSGNSIFNMADVNLLFQSPLKPQSLLMFRMAGQMGAMFLVSLYALFQLPNLMLNMGLSIGEAMSIILSWSMILVTTQMISIFVYSLASAHRRLRNFIKPFVIILVGAVAGAFAIYWRSGELGVFDAAVRFFNAPATRWIPIWGWHKGIVMFVCEGNIASFFIVLLLTIAVLAVLIYLSWHVINADFYEEALAKSAEMAELRQATAAANSSGGVTLVRRKKERSDELMRDQFNRGSGANIYFHKAMYERRRFAKLGFFTGTMITYILVTVIALVLMKLVLHYESIYIVALVLGGMAFFRSLNNSILKDVEMIYFTIIPESPAKKILYALLGGTANCFLDLVIPMIIATVVLGSNVFTTLMLVLFIVSIDFYSSNVETFLQLVLPTHISAKIKQMIHILFIYFGLLLPAIFVIIGFALDLVVPMLLIATAACVGMGLFMLIFSPRIVENGRR